MDVVNAKFKETSDVDKDWLTGDRKFECDANGAEDIKMYELMQFDTASQTLEDHLAIQWVAHGRVYRAVFGLGLLCDVRGARMDYINGTVKLVIPTRDECKPKEIGNGNI